MSPSASGPTSFADRLAALVSERRSQICLGLDPIPDQEPWRSGAGAAAAANDPRAAAAAAVEAACRRLIDEAGAACVAVKPQLARFEALGAPGWAALERVCAAASEADLLVLADGKRGDVPVSASAYASALLASTPVPGGEAPGLGADAVTVSAMLGADSLQPFIETAASRGAGVFALVRTSNPGAADLLDLDTDSGPVHERLAALVDAAADRLRGECGLSGAGAVVGATEPRYLHRLRELMPSAIFLLPGVGAQGGRPQDLGPAFAPGRASAIVTASRSIAGAAEPARAASELREQVWSAAGG